MPSCPQGLRGGWRWGEEGGRKKEKPPPVCICNCNYKREGLILKGKRVWICIVPVRFVLVPRAGIEPAQPCGPGILSPLRLPVPPSGHELYRILVSG